MLNHEELAARFNVAQDQLKPALVAAGWAFHEDANGRLWAVPQEATAGPGGRTGREDN